MCTRIARSGQRRRSGRAPVTAGGIAPFPERNARLIQAAFGSVSLTALTLSTTTSLSSALVSR